MYQRRYFPLNFDELFLLLLLLRGPLSQNDTLSQPASQPVNKGPDKFLYCHVTVLPCGMSLIGIIDNTSSSFPVSFGSSGWPTDLP